ncbi:MAG: hypothetical protein AB9869_10295 [Verrucomicrobiia bacterium]
MNTRILASILRLAHGHRIRHGAAARLAVLALAVAGIAGRCPGAPSLEIEKAVCLAWPDQALEEQIVVGATSLTGPWVPWPEPIFKRYGELCMMVPAASVQQFFRLVAGAQFIDDFDAARWPCASKGDWVTQFIDPKDVDRLVVNNVNGTLQVQAVTAPVNGRLALIPPGPAVVVGDFSASLDIVGWDPNATMLAASIGARTGSANADYGYYGVVYFNEESKGKGSLHLFPIWTNSVISTPFAITPGQKYRLNFSGVGNQLSLLLFDLSNPEQPLSQVQLTDDTSSQGAVILAIGTLDKSRPGSITVDNFFVTGTKP